MTMTWTTPILSSIKAWACYVDPEGEAWLCAAFIKQCLKKPPKRISVRGSTRQSEDAIEVRLSRDDDGQIRWTTPEYPMCPANWDSMQCYRLLQLPMEKRASRFLDAGHTTVWLTVYDHDDEEESHAL